MSDSLKVPGHNSLEPRSAEPDPDADTEEIDVDVLVVASQPLQVLSQTVLLASPLSHKPCTLNAAHCLGDSLLTLPTHSSIVDVLVVVKMDVLVEVDVVRVVMSHPLHVRSHPPGTTSVPHKPSAAID